MSNQAENIQKYNNSVRNQRAIDHFRLWADDIADLGVREFFLDDVDHAEILVENNHKSADGVIEALRERLFENTA